MVEMAQRTPDGLSTAHRWTVLAICASAMLLVGLDTTIVTVGLPEIGDATGVGTDRLAWVVDAYTVPFAALLITSGALADRFGRRRVFQTGLTVFGLSSLACAAAPSLELLVAARVVQGVGASMLTPVALAIVVSVMTDPRDRARAIGIWSATFGLSLAIGPVTGGALIAALDWRAVFWINVPLVLAALVLVALLVPESRAVRPRRLDLPGQALLVVILGIAVALLIEGPHLGWGSPAAVTAYVILTVATVALWWVESHRTEPLIETGLFRNRGFSGAIVGAVAMFMAFSMVLLLATLLLQGGQGYSPVAAGAATLPMALATLLCAPLSGYLVGRLGPRLPLALSGAFLLAGGVVLISLAVEASMPQLVVAFVFTGAAVGLSGPPITSTAVASLPPSRTGVAGGFTSTARQVGIALGMAVGGGVAAAGMTASGMLPGWIIVTSCGVVVLGVAAWGVDATRPRR